jgi:hypothetical protein
MTRILAFSFLAFVMLSLWSCSRYSGCTDLRATNFEPDAFTDDGSCEYGFGGGGGGNGNANLTFYNNQSWVGVVTVTISGYSAQITETVDASNCDYTGCANFSLSAGSYYYTATATTGEYWSGSVVVTSSCQLFEFV